MAASRTLGRLLHLLELQEEQARRVATEAAAEAHRLHSAQSNAAAREREGRRLVGASARTGAVADRVAGLEEIRIARRVAAMLTPLIEAAEREEERRRQEFLARRTERRQAETLLDAAERSAARAETRRAQQTADDLHLGRMGREHGRGGR